MQKTVAVSNKALVIVIEINCPLVVVLQITAAKVCETRGHNVPVMLPMAASAFSS